MQFLEQQIFFCATDDLVRTEQSRVEKRIATSECSLTIRLTFLGAEVCCSAGDLARATERGDWKSSSRIKYTPLHCSRLHQHAVAVVLTWLEDALCSAAEKCNDKALRL